MAKDLGYATPQYRNFHEYPQYVPRVGAPGYMCSFVLRLAGFVVRGATTTSIAGVPIHLSSSKGVGQTYGQPSMDVDEDTCYLHTSTLNFMNPQRVAVAYFSFYI